MSTAGVFFLQLLPTRPNIDRYGVCETRQIKRVDRHTVRRPLCVTDDFDRHTVVYASNIETFGPRDGPAAMITV